MSGADWTVLEIEGVEDVARRAAKRVARDFSDTTTVEDATQDALILLATTSSLRQTARDTAKGLGMLYHELHMDLINRYRTEAQRRTRLVSLESVLEGA